MGGRASLRWVMLRRWGGPCRTEVLLRLSLAVALRPSPSAALALQCPARVSGLALQLGEVERKNKLEPIRADGDEGSLLIAVAETR